MKAVILAGGLGSRMRPFTDVIPKPLLPLGDKALLEIQAEALQACGVTDIFLATNYKADYVKNFMGDGSRYGVRFHYSREDMPLGTCGPITLLKEHLTEPFLLMNGDVLTKADFADLYQFALRYPDSPFTIGTKVITQHFRYGSIKSDNEFVLGVEEKPDLTFEILAGVYVLKPSVFELVPDNTYYGMDTLIEDLVAAQKPITKYRIEDYWIDVGVVEDYEEAQRVYLEQFKQS